jgi:shikimate kinase
MTPPPKTVYIIVGPKGSGKTHVGTMLDRELGLRFLSVEPLVLKNLNVSSLTGDDLEREGFLLEEQAIDTMLMSHDAVSFEATGSSRFFPETLERLREKYTVRLIRLRCPLDTCAARVAHRDPTNHIPVSDERLRDINHRANAVELDWDLEIDNAAPASDESIIAQFRALLRLDNPADG